MKDIYEELIRWAMDRGVKLTGIKPETIPGRGTGIVATRELEVIDTIIVFENKLI